MTDAVDVKQEEHTSNTSTSHINTSNSHTQETTQQDQAEETPHKSRTVSFNKDVHVKRFGTSRPAPPAPVIAEPAVRKKHLDLTKEQLAEEAAKVLKQASSTHCSSTGAPDKFFSLPNRKKHKPRPDTNSYFPTRRRSEELGVTSEAPKRSPKSSIGRSNSDVSSKKQRKGQKSPLLNLFKKSSPETNKTELQPKKVTVKRSKSDVSDLKSSNSQNRIVRKRSGSESEEYLNSVIGKKSQLSPIIEISQPDDYLKNPLKKLSPEGNLNQSTGNLAYKVNPIEKPPRVNKNIKPPVRPVRSKTVTEKDYTAADRKKTAQVFGTLPKNKAAKKLFIDEVDVRSRKDIKQSIKEAITSLEKSKKDKPADMIHSSQRPPEKLPLTKGQTVDNMVRILNNDKFSPPPKAPIFMPPSTAAHNNNQPFSYTKPSVSPDPNLYARSVSPDRIPSPVNKTPGQGIIYAQVVCGNNNENRLGSKQTVHTTVTPGKQFGQISDEDEGLGYEDSKFNSSKYIDHTDYHKSMEDSYRSPNDYVLHPDSPITPRFKEYNSRRYDEEHASYGDGYLESHDYENFDKARHMDENERRIADLSYRRDMLESRLNARKLRDRSLSPGEMNIRRTPERDIDLDLKNKYPIDPIDKQYDDHDLKSAAYFASENKKANTLSKRSAASKSKYSSKTATDLEIDRREFIDRRLAEEPLDTSYFSNNKTRKYFPPEPEYDPPSLDSQTGRLKYSPDGRKFKPKTSRQHTSQEALHKYSSKHRERFNDGRDRYASNPEIMRRDDYNNQYDSSHPETFHNSLKRQKYGHLEERRYGGDTSGPESSRSRYEGDNKLVDSGIENDYRKDSNGDIRHKSEFNKKYTKNDSEDEGFASSLLIPSERHRFNQESDENATLRRDDFIHRERSIDDGSFYDPRIDKFEAKKSLSSKPPKATKKISGLEKVKQLFSRDSSKKSKKEKFKVERDDEDLRKRYTEYRGNHSSGEEYRDSVDRVNGHSSDIEYGTRRRLATPNQSPKENRNDTLQRSKGWFKSLDRLSTKKSRSNLNEKESVFTSTEEESNINSKRYTGSSSRPVTKNLRFFGDSDMESTGSGNKRYQNNTLDHSRKKISASVQGLDRSNLKNSYRSSSMGNLQSSTQNLNTRDKYSNSRRNLHNISEIHSNSETESQFDDSVRKQSVYKQHSYDLDSRRDERKPPVNPYKDQKTRSQISSKSSKTLKHGYSNGDLQYSDDPSEMRSRRRRTHNGINGSPGDSSTEGDSSHQSQKSVVYLHAATVGDIPVRRVRGKQRDDLSSITSSRIQPQTKTVTRSFSVLAPWKPRHYSEAYDINYSQTQSSTLKRSNKVPNKKDSSSSSSLLGKGRSPSTKNLSSSRYEEENIKKGPSSTLSRYSNSRKNGTLSRRDSSSKENLDSNISRSRNDIRTTRDKKNMSAEMLSKAPKRSSIERERLSRSISMPKDPNKSAGWFKINKKSKKSESTNRLY